MHTENFNNSEIDHNAHGPTEVQLPKGLNETKNKIQERVFTKEGAEIDVVIQAIEKGTATGGIRNLIESLSSLRTLDREGYQKIVDALISIGEEGVTALIGRFYCLKKYVDMKETAFKLVDAGYGSMLVSDLRFLVADIPEPYKTWNNFSELQSPTDPRITSRMLSLHGLDPCELAEKFIEKGELEPISLIFELDDTHREILKHKYKSQLQDADISYKGGNWRYAMHDRD